MATEEIVNSSVKCPKCKSKDLFLTEVWKDSTVQWQQINGKFDRNDGVLSPDGSPYRVEAHCSKCDHRWKIKSAMQIDDVIKQTK